MKYAMKIISVICLISLLLAISADACADWSINNQIRGGSTTSPYPPFGQNLFYTASNANKVQRPNDGDYCSRPYTIYVNAPKGHSVYVYDYWSANDENNIGTTYHGSRVTVIAEHGDFSCILYHKQDYDLRVAWVRAANLSSYYPGEVFNIGYKGNWNTENIGDPTMYWSRDYFVGTRRKYSFPEEPIPNCVGFTLDYQLTNPNGSQNEDILGPRNIYINDGSGWLFVGSFSYQHKRACHINISLSEPTTIVAVATIADCRDPDNFIFRQSLLDVMCTA